MSSLFSKDNAKRQHRARGRKSKAAAWKDLCPVLGKSLHSVPEVIEEDDGFYQQTLPTTPSSCASQIARSVSGSLGGRVTPSGGVLDVKHVERRKSKPRPTGLTGAEVISFPGAIDLEYESPRPAPRPPRATSPTPSSSGFSSYESDGSSSPDSFSLQFSDIGLALDFPHPPALRRSPTPSLMSSSTRGSTNKSSSSIGLPTTPVTSDDEFCPSPFPRATPVLPLVIHNKAVPTSEDEDDDSDWYTKQFEDILTLRSSFPAFVQESSTDKLSARPDSIMPRRRGSTPSTESTCPSAQFDPTFSVRRRTAIKLPSRPPPPLPSARRCSRPSRDSISVARCPRNDLTISIPSRPPPRMSVPADINDIFSETFSPDGHAVLARGNEVAAQEFFLSPDTPSVYSQDTAGCDGEYYAHEMEYPVRLDLDLELSPMDLQLEIATTLEQVQRLAQGASETAIPDTPVGQMYSPLPYVERALRSRWSSSTLSTIAEGQRGLSASSRILRFNFASRRGKTKSPKTVVERKSMDSLFGYYTMESRLLGRRGSRGSQGER